MRAKAVILTLVIAGGLGGLALSLSVFSGKPSWKTKTWLEGQAAEQIPNPPHLERPERDYLLQGQTLFIQQQNVAGVPVEGSYRKVVRRGDTLAWVKAHYISAQELPSERAIQEQLSSTDGLEAKSKKVAYASGCAKIYNLKPLLRWRRGAFRLVFTRDCESTDGTLQQLAFNNQGRMLTREGVGSHFNWGNARVMLFPKGPKLSNLETTDVAISAQPFFLQTPQVEVTSDAGIKIRHLNELEMVRTGDPSFDMVQAYFFTSNALSWAEKQFGVNIDRLKVRTHVGHPEKSNVAFYFGREIRLGEGDDISFSKIAWDPSIVVHEVMHGVIEALTGLPFKGEQGTMQEAFADSLTALHLSSPLMGAAAYKNGAYQRNLENQMKLSDRNGKMYHDSLIISGTIWEIKESVGDSSALDLITFLLARGTPDMGFKDVRTNFQSWLNACTLGERCDRIGSIFSQRGWL